MLRFATLLFFASSLSFAGNWSGFLVDANCLASEEHNVTKNTSPAERDTNFELVACRPGAKTKDFAVVLPGWDVIRFDAAGNAKAAEFLRNAAGKSGQRFPMTVTVDGDRNQHTINVNGISASNPAAD